MTLRIEPLGDPHALGDAWDDLLARSASSSPFLRRAWVEPWWEVFGARFRSQLLAARDAAGRLVGIAPCVVGRGPGRLRGHLRHLMLLGQRADTLAEHLDWIVEAGREAEVVPALADALLATAGRAWDVLYFERVREDSPCLPLIEARLRARGLTPRRGHPQDSPYVRLPASLAELLAAKSRNFRQQYARAERALAAHGPVRLLRAGEDIGLAEAMDALVALHRARWGAGGGSFRTEAYRAFHDRLSRRLAEEGALLLLLLQVGDVTVAARYDFLHDGRIWCFQGGWDPAYDHARPGTLATARTLAWGIEHGWREYDFLVGDDPYKARWATGARRLVDLEAFAPTLRARLYRLLGRARARA